MIAGASVSLISPASWYSGVNSYYRTSPMPIDPPSKDPPPRWARELVHAANARNRARGSIEAFSMADLTAAWVACGGCCSVSGLPFNLLVVGDGQAKRPFAPSLDRIDRHQPYQRNNVRLVVSIANFAINAWGMDPSCS